MAVRRAEAHDAGALAELNGLVQRLHVAHEPDVFKPTDPREVTAWFAAELAAGRRLFWVALSGDDVVGYVCVVPEERDEDLFCRARSWWDVEQIGVRPEWRGRGAARTLLQAVAAAARETGVGELQISSWSFNPGAHEAWAHLGFTPLTGRYRLDLEDARTHSP